MRNSWCEWHIETTEFTHTRPGNSNSPTRITGSRYIKGILVGGATSYRGIESTTSVDIRLNRHERASIFRILARVGLLSLARALSVLVLGRGQKRKEHSPCTPD